MSPSCALWGVYTQRSFLAGLPRHSESSAILLSGGLVTRATSLQQHLFAFINCKWVTLGRSEIHTQSEEGIEIWSSEDDLKAGIFSTLASLELGHCRRSERTY